MKIKKRLCSFTAAVSMLISGISLPVSALNSDITYHYNGAEHTRSMEYLDRGLIAVKTDGGIYLGWRLLGTEGSVENILASPSFNVYRDGEFIANVNNSTNYLDTGGNMSSSYRVAPVFDGKEGNLCNSVTAFASGGNYFDIPLSKPEDETVEYLYPYTDSEGVVSTNATFSFFPADCSTGDLDGDGEYEIIVKWTSSERDVGSPGSPEYSGTVRFAAYKLDGTKLWENDINLGKNVYSSAHTVQFLVYDFDGDGKSEMICQTSLGSTDSSGRYVSHSADPVNSADIYNFTDEQNKSADYRGYGRIITGEEFLTVFNGETGLAVDTISLPTARDGSGETKGVSFGDDFGNRSNRFLADVAYLDGEKPFAVYMRGYYFGRNGRQRTSICGVSFDGKRLSPDYHFDTDNGQPGYYDGAEIYVGNGNHNCTVADVDGDGKDEFITGALCMEVKEDNSFKPRWCTFMEHGDALHIGDYDPTHPGFEFFTVHEDFGPNTMSGEDVNINYGMSVIDADSGEIIFHADGTSDTGRGIMANVGLGGYYQITSSNAGSFQCAGQNNFSTINTGMSMNFRVFWDGDLYDELLDGTAVTSWNGSSMSQIFNADGCVKINGTKSNPALQADLFGDWREELVYPTTDGSSLRVFTSTDITKYKLPTLMHDPVYRSGVAAQQTAYNQPPHVGFYMDDNTFLPKVTGMEIVSYPPKTNYNVGEQLDTSGLSVKISYNNGTDSILTEGFTVTGFSSLCAGTQTLTVSYNDKTAVFDVNVQTGLVIENNTVTGCQSGDEKITVPINYNGNEVTKIGGDAFKNNTVLVSLTIMPSVTEIADNTFEGCDNLNIICVPGSTAHIYAIEHNIPFTLMDGTDINYVLKAEFDEEEYSDFSMRQSVSEQNKTISGIKYTVPGRGGKREGDGTSGFETSDTDRGKALKICVGRFGNSGREPYFTFNNTISPGIGYDCVFKTDIFIPSPNPLPEPIISLKNEFGEVIDYIYAEKLNIEYDTWYTYKLICSNGKYYRTLYSGDGLISFDELTTPSSSGFVSSIYAAQNSGTFSNLQYTHMYMDSMSVYTAQAAVSSAEITVSDKYGSPVGNADITVTGGKLSYSLTSNLSGSADITLPAGVYDLQITCQNFNDYTGKLILFENSVSNNITMSDETLLRYSEGTAEIISHKSVQGDLIFAGYDDKGILVKIERLDADTSKNSLYHLPDGFDGMKIKVLLWDILDRLVPLTKSAE